MTENFLSASFLDHLLESENFSHRIDTAKALREASSCFQHEQILPRAFVKTSGP